VLYTRPAVCIKVCKHVHGRPWTYSKISIHTAGRVRRSRSLCTRPCAILFTAGRVHLPPNTDGCWAVNNITNQEVWLVIQLLCDLQPCLFASIPITHYGVTTVLFLFCIFKFEVCNNIGDILVDVPNQNIGVCPQHHRQGWRQWSHIICTCIGLL